MLADQWRAIVRGAEYRIVLEGVVSRLDGNEPRRQRPSHRIGRAVVGTPPTISAGIEIEHVLPGEVFERLYAERFHLIQMLIADAPSHRLHSSAVQLCEVNVEERRIHVELYSERQHAEQEEKRQRRGQGRRRSGDSGASATKLKAEHSSKSTAATEQPETQPVGLAVTGRRPCWPRRGCRRRSGLRSAPKERRHRQCDLCRILPVPHSALV